MRRVKKETLFSFESVHGETRLKMGWVVKKYNLSFSTALSWSKCILTVSLYICLSIYTNNKTLYGVPFYYLFPIYGYPKFIFGYPKLSWLLDIHNSIIGYPKMNYGYPKIHPDFWISINQFLDIQKSVEYWVFIIWFLDIQKSNYRYPKIHPILGYP